MNMASHYSESSVLLTEVIFIMNHIMEVGFDNMESKKRPLQIEGGTR